nr:RNA polymerase sigma factor [Dissulfurirhabdus thermomarina]
MPETGGADPDRRAALDRFLGEVQVRAFRMAHFATGDREEALDIVQDAMFALVRGYGGRPPAEWRPLFFRVLQNRIRDWHRRTAVRRRWRRWLHGPDREGEGAAAGDPLQEVADPGGRDPSDAAADRAARDALERAIRELPLRQQQAFLLRAWEGLGVAETAAAMGCSEGSVKTHYSRAVHALRRRLEAYRP